MQATYLEGLLKFLGMLAVDLLYSRYIILEIAASMFPSLQALSKQSGGLQCKQVWSAVLLPSLLSASRASTYSVGVKVWHSILVVGAQISACAGRQAGGRRGGGRRRGHFNPTVGCGGYVGRRYRRVVKGVKKATVDGCRGDVLSCGVAKLLLELGARSAVSSNEQPGNVSVSHFCTLASREPQKI